MFLNSDTDIFPLICFREHVKRGCYHRYIMIVIIIHSKEYIYLPSVEQSPTWRKRPFQATLQAESIIRSIKMYQEKVLTSLNIEQTKS